MYENKAYDRFNFMVMDGNDKEFTGIHQMKTIFFNFNFEREGGRESHRANLMKISSSHSTFRKSYHSYQIYAHLYCRFCVNVFAPFC